jgi:hypothetical protein
MSGSAASGLLGANPGAAQPATSSSPASQKTLFEGVRIISGSFAKTDKQQKRYSIFSLLQTFACAIAYKTSKLTENVGEGGL